ncbi:MAG: YggS family pyridoxal phosphate-dependent enzyme [Bdellovibrionota bacterium]|nr:MAG: YggS family pyridoxal phosphate-dependent enzyme [Bdellovibrionota bacterium]
MASDPSLVERFEATYRQVAEAMSRSTTAGGPVHVVAATKKQPVASINAYIAWCRRKHIPVLIGENYVQEFKRKKTELQIYDQAHLLGALQSNKVSMAVRLFDVIQSVHTVQILEAIFEQCTRQRRRLSVFLQVNVSGDPGKAGFAPEQLVELLPLARSCPWVTLQGLMTITRLYETPEQARPDFKRMRELRGALGWPAAELSMGMSSDFPIAIEEGATHVRIGTALFGERGIVAA